MTQPDSPGAQWQALLQDAGRGHPPQARFEAAVEAILFAAGEPVELAVLASALEMEQTLCKTLLDRMLFGYNQREGGIVMRRLDDSYQLCSNPAQAACVRAVLDRKREVSLSPAALEVLAITAYNQPVTRAFLEQVRGVDSSGVVASLLEKELLEERGRLDAPGRPMQFGTTAAFLRCFGLSSLEELPPVDERGALIAQLEFQET
ncbi:MAG: SMC-Scp complex subunit ScpB [Clostridiales bacterium]|nr:SMC-Scp complex subunit ScpB [Clostridiales bacterium]